VSVGGVCRREAPKPLGQHGIYVWDGNYCALAVMGRQGLEPKGGMLRVGPVHYNTAGETGRLFDELEVLVKSG